VRQTTRPITRRGGDGISVDPDAATTRHERGVDAATCMTTRTIWPRS